MHRNGEEKWRNAVRELLLLLLYALCSKKVRLGEYIPVYWVLMIAVMPFCKSRKISNVVFLYRGVIAKSNESWSEYRGGECEV